MLFCGLMLIPWIFILLFYLVIVIFKKNARLIGKCKQMNNAYVRRMFDRCKIFIIIFFIYSMLLSLIRNSVYHDPISCHLNGDYFSNFYRNLLVTALMSAIITWENLKYFLLILFFLLLPFVVSIHPRVHSRKKIHLMGVFNNLRRRI